MSSCTHIFIYFIFCFNVYFFNIFSIYISTFAMLYCFAILCNTQVAFTVSAAIKIKFLIFFYFYLILKYFL